MSFLKPKKDNPVTKWIQWSGSKGIFEWYDKEKKENIPLEFPLKFIVLDEFSKISGYNPALETGFYSNEVHDLSKEILNVKAHSINTYLISGFYKDIKDKIATDKGKFAKSVYAIMFTKEFYELVNILMVGSSLGAWIEKKFNTDRYSVMVNGSIEDKVGGIKFFKPVFEIEREISKTIREKITPIAVELDEFFQSRKQNEQLKEVIETELPHTDEAQEVINAIAEKENVNGEVVSVDDGLEPLPF